jgi:HK97 family phage portal protein
MKLLDKAASLLDKTSSWLRSNQKSYTTTDAEWYARNGYYRLADLAGYSSYSGKAITSSTALEASAVYACVKILSEDMGTLPFNLMRRSLDGKSVEKARDHALFSTLHDLVNPDVSAGEFVESLTAQAALGLDGYARIERVGRRVYLNPLQSTDVRTDQDSRDRVVYLVRNGNGREEAVDKQTIFHLRGWTLDCVRGDPILSRSRHSIGITLSAQEFAGSYFANDVSAGLFLQHPGVGSAALGTEGVDLVKKAYREKQGSGKAGEPFVLQEGMEASRVDPDLEKMQLVEVRKFQILEACRIWRMPPVKLAELGRATWNNIGELNRQYASETLAPWIRRWRESVYRCLLTWDEQVANRLYAEHNVEGLLRGNFEKQTEAFSKLLERGVYSINEVRRWLNLNPIPGGDEHLVQLNMADVQNIAKAAALEVLRELKSLTFGKQRELLEEKIAELAA